MTYESLSPWKPTFLPFSELDSKLRLKQDSRRLFGKNFTQKTARNVAKTAPSGLRGYPTSCLG